MVRLGIVHIQLNTRAGVEVRSLLNGKGGLRRQQLGALTFLDEAVRHGKLRPCAGQVGHLGGGAGLGLQFSVDEVRHQASHKVLVKGGDRRGKGVVSVDVVAGLHLIYEELSSAHTYHALTSTPTLK